MANLTDNILWEGGIYQLETSDLVLGGPGGIANEQAQQLANRTAWLKDKVGLVTHFDALLNIVANTILDESVIGKNIVVDADEKTINITLPDPSSVRAGIVIPISAINVNQSQVAVTAPGIFKIRYGAVLHQSVYMDDLEQIWLIANGTNWILMPLKYAMQEVGMVCHSYRVLPCTLPLHGQLVNRADEPRLWHFINESAGSASLVTDVQWMSSINYRGFFSKGNDSTTFRLPDLRSQFIRGLDSSRGLSYGRTSVAAGGYEPDNNKNHNHPYRDRYYPEKGSEISAGAKRMSMPTGYNGGLGSKGTDTDNTQWLYYDADTDSSGGSEAVSKNIGLIPLIRK